MKLGTIVIMVLMVSLVFAAVGNIINDMENYYDVEVNHTLGEDYDYTNRINRSVYGIRKDLAKLSDEDEGWFTKTGVLALALPKASITAAKVLFTSMVYGISILGNIASELTVPSPIISALIVGIIIIVVFAILSYWRRYPA